MKKLDQQIKIKVNEIFQSIQGESTWTGVLTTFVRTTACNLRCHYCDTAYAFHEGSWLSIQNVLDRIREFGSRYVCITGGEPLLQKDVLMLMNLLVEEGYLVSLETSGSKSIEDVPSAVKIILDVKTPGSGESTKNLFQNVSLLEQRRVQNFSPEIKFVIVKDSDFYWAHNLATTFDFYKRHIVLFSPSWDDFSPEHLAKLMISVKSEARLQLQAHKVIWGSTVRGV